MATKTSTAAASGTWRLGDLTVNRIGFGAMRLAARRAFDHEAPERDRSASIAVLRKAVDLGVNHVDTAAFYFSARRSANELINSALAPYPHDLVITTKVGPARDSSGEWMDWPRPEQLRGQLEENLRQLGRDHLDVVNLRLMGPGSLADHFGVLSDLRDAGLIRHLGLSNARAEHIDEAQAIAPVVCVQNRYSISGRRTGADDLLQVCGARGIAFVPFFAIAGTGAEGGNDAPDDGAVLAAAAAHGVTTAQVKLAWTLAQGAHVLAIPGTGDLEHLVQNIAAGGLRLTTDELAALQAC